jgi:hypothetical protein
MATECLSGRCPVRQSLASDPRASKAAGHRVRVALPTPLPASLRPQWIFPDGCDGLHTIDAEAVPQVGHRAVTLVCPS